MNLLERAALLDFVLSVIWPSRTLTTATTAGQTVFSVKGSWDTAHDWPMAWVNGNRVAATLTGTSQVTLAAGATLGAQVLVLVSPGAGSGYLPRGGGAAMLADLDLGSHRLRKLAPSVAHDDGVRRDEVEQIVVNALEGNYLLKTGDSMSGELLLPAASAILAAAAAVRRDMVALLDGSQAFTAAVAGVTPTLAAHLATKGYVDDALLIPRWPNRSHAFSVQGGYGWTVPAGVTKVLVCVIGASGAAGECGTSLTSGNSFIGTRSGGKGGRCCVLLPVVPGETLSVTVGAKGTTNYDSNDNVGRGGNGGGYSKVSNADSSRYAKAGGGGGGGSGQDWVAYRTNGGNGTDAETGGLGGYESWHVGGNTDGGAGGAISSSQDVVDWAFADIATPAAGVANIDYIGQLNGVDYYGENRALGLGRDGVVVLRWMA